MYSEVREQRDHINIEFVSKMNREWKYLEHSQPDCGGDNKAKDVDEYFYFACFLFTLGFSLERRYHQDNGETSQTGFDLSLELCLRSQV